MFGFVCGCVCVGECVYLRVWTHLCVVACVRVYVCGCVYITCVYV